MILFDQFLPKITLKNLTSKQPNQSSIMWYLLTCSSGLSKEQLFVDYQRGEND